MSRRTVPVLLLAAPAACRALLPLSTSGRTRSSTRTSTSRSSRPSTSTSTSTTASGWPRWMRRAWPSGRTPALQGAQSRVQGAQADHPVRVALRLPADQRHRGRQRRHRRRHRLLHAPDRDALHRLLRRLPARAAPRDDAPVPVRHLVTRPRRRRTPDASSRSRRRSGSSRAWRSTCRSGRSTRTRRCGCGTRRSKGSCRPSSR